MTRFGLLVPHFGEEADQDLLIEGARLADRLGFDSLWVRDHLYCHAHGMESTDRTFIEQFVTLTYLTAVTDRIGLGAATIIPFRHPINMAYSVASMSWITRRPFDLGIGAGTFQHEFDVIGQGSAERPAMMRDRKSTRLNSSHGSISYAVFCLKKKNYDHSHSHFGKYKKDHANF